MCSEHMRTDHITTFTAVDYCIEVLESLKNDQRVLIKSPSQTLNALCSFVMCQLRVRVIAEWNVLS